VTKKGGANRSAGCSGTYSTTADAPSLAVTAGSILACTAVTLICAGRGRGQQQQAERRKIATHPRTFRLEERRARLDLEEQAATRRALNIGAEGHDARQSEPRSMYCRRATIWCAEPTSTTPGRAIARRGGMKVPKLGFAIWVSTSPPWGPHYHEPLSLDNLVTQRVESSR